MHHQTLQHFLLHPVYARRDESILIACIFIVMTMALSSFSKQRHRNPHMLLLSAFEDCGVVFFLLISLVIAVALQDLKTVRAFEFLSHVEMYQGPTSTTPRNFNYSFNPDRAGMVNR